MMKIKCWTVFDITETGVKSHFRPACLPTKTKTGLVLTTERDWITSRNQQRNWETMTQIIALRIQPESITTPKVVDAPSALSNLAGKAWSFTFQAPIDAFRDDTGDIGLLLADTVGIPVVAGLTEDVQLTPILNPYGDSPNIHFEVMNDD